MATGRLGNVVTTGATVLQLYQVPAGKVASFTVNACNQTAAAVTVSIGLCNSTASFSTNEYIEYQFTVPAYSSFERSGLILDASKYVNVQASVAGVSFVAYGYEE